MKPARLAPGLAAADALIVAARKSFGIAVAAAASHRCDADAQILTALTALDSARMELRRLADGDDTEPGDIRIPPYTLRGRKPGRKPK